MNYITAKESDTTVIYGNRDYRIQKDRNYRHIVVFEGGIRKKISVKTVENDCVFNYIFECGFKDHPCPAMDYWIYRHRLGNRISVSNYKIKFEVKSKSL